MRQAAKPDVLFAGITSVSTNPTPCASTPDACFEVLLQADPDNTVDVFIGNSIVQSIQLQPGHSITIETNNIKAFYCVTSSTTALLNYLALGVGNS